MKQLTLDKADLIDEPFKGWRKQYPHKKIETDYMLRYNGRKHRVYCYQISNAGSMYINTKTGKIWLDVNY